MMISHQTRRENRVSPSTADLLHIGASARHTSDEVGFVSGEQPPAGGWHAPWFALPKWAGGGTTI